MLPCTTGARPGKMNMMSLPYCASSRLFPERKPSPKPTSSSKEPTPQAMPNIVRNERSLCAQRVRKICAKMSRSIRIIYRYRYCTFDVSGAAFGSKVLMLPAPNPGLPAPIQLRDLRHPYQVHRQLTLPTVTLTLHSSRPLEASREVPVSKRFSGIDLASCFSHRADSARGGSPGASVTGA